MTITFDLDKYKELLIKYHPKLIRNEEENEKALAIVEELMHRQNLTPEEDEILDLLVTLIEKFEEEHYPLGQSSTPHSILLFLMEQQDIKPSDLVRVIGSKELVSKVIIDKREISKAEAKALGFFFKVDPVLFIW